MAVQQEVGKYSGNPRIWREIRILELVLALFVFSTSEIYKSQK